MNRGENKVPTVCRFQSYNQKVKLVQLDLSTHLQVQVCPKSNFNLARKDLRYIRKIKNVSQGNHPAQPGSISTSQCAAKPLSEESTYKMSKNETSSNLPKDER